MDRITVKSKTASFRRAGLAFSREGVTLNREELSDEQLEALVLEPNLVLFDPDSEKSEREQVADLEAFRAEARNHSVHRGELAGDDPEGQGEDDGNGPRGLTTVTGESGNDGESAQGESGAAVEAAAKPASKRKGAK